MARCVTDGDYFVEVDWDGDGSFADTYDNVSDDLTMNTAVVTAYGRDESRALAPSSAGTMGFELCDPDAVYSLDNPDSPIVYDIGPGRTARLRVNRSATDYILFQGRIDDIGSVSLKYHNNVPITVYDGLAELAGVNLSTSVYHGKKTGELMHVILDEVGWPPGLRRISTGHSTVLWWWEEGTNALEAANKLVATEGPPAIIYIDPATGEFVFEDRLFRLLRTESQDVQSTYCVDLTACDVESPCPTGSHPYTDPFEYNSGLKDIINSVNITVTERGVARYPVEVWALDVAMRVSNDVAIYTIESDSDPFIQATVSTSYFGTGTVATSLSRTSGQSTTLFVTVTGTVTLTRITVMARPVEVIRSFQVKQEETGSIAQYGQRGMTFSAPWCGANDAAAIAEIITAHYAFKRATVRIRVANCDGATVDSQLQRVIGDRVRIINSRYKLDDEFIIERIERTVVGRGMIHAVVYSCEKVVTQPLNAFTFDVVDLGFDDGVFGISGLSDPDTLFIFGTAGRGFDDGRFAY